MEQYLSYIRVPGIAYQTASRCLRVRYNVVAVRPEFRTSWILRCTVQYFGCELLSKNRLGEVSGGPIDTTVNLQLFSKLFELCGT